MPRKKTNEEFIAELELKRGGEYTPLEEYKGNQTKIRILHNICENVIEIRPKDLLVNKVKCSHCSGNAKFSIEDMKHFIESESNSECKLLSSEVKNTQSKLDLKCQCGNEFTTTFSYFKHENKRQCNDCGNKNRNKSQKHTYEYVKSFIENDGFSLLSTEYANNKSPLTIECNNKHIYQQTFSDFAGGHRCRQCQYENNGDIFRKSYSEVKSYIEDEGYSLLSDIYNNSKKKLEIKCDGGHVFSMTFDSFAYANQRCPQCYLDRIRENATSHIFVWLREQTQDWKIASMRNHNYRCVVTNQPMDVVHHIYSFNLIAKEVMEILEMPILENLSDYTNEQIESMRSKCIELHDKYGLGVCLTKEIHNLYHNLYGFVNNQEQFDEFLTRYHMGEFQEHIAS